jgi:hypothetical protein
MSFRLFAFTGAAAALLAIPLPAMAAPLSTEAPLATDFSSQVDIRVGPGGVRVGHDRYDSRDRRVHDRFESRRRDRRCVTERTTRTTPSGRVIREKKTVCR